MEYPKSPYLYRTEYGGLRIVGSRVSLDSVVTHFQRGKTPEQIVESFPTLKLSHVYGAIAYYLEHKQLVKDYLAEVDREFRMMAPPLREQAPELHARLMAARDRMRLKGE